MTVESALSPIEEQTLRALSPDVPRWAAEIAGKLPGQTVAGIMLVLAEMEDRTFVSLGLGGWTRTSEGTAALAETRSGVEVSGE